MEKTKKDPDKFLNTVTDAYRADMIKLDKEISRIMKGEERVLWTGKFWGGSDQNIIGFGKFTYVRKGKKIEWFLIGLAQQKNYISLYVNAVEDNQYLAQKYGKELGKVKIGSSSISFRKLEDVNLKKLLEMLKRAKALAKSS
jgi:hypothetical protein